MEYDGHDIWNLFLLSVSLFCLSFCYKFNLLFISEEAELQCVPGHFESVEEYIRVFEPLLFEECRAQLYSSWEESTETISSHVKVHIRNIERRERGTFEILSSY